MDVTVSLVAACDTTLVFFSLLEQRYGFLWRVSYLDQCHVLGTGIAVGNKGVQDVPPVWAEQDKRCRWDGLRLDQAPRQRKFCQGTNATLEDEKAICSGQPPQARQQVGRVFFAVDPGIGPEALLAKRGAGDTQGAPAGFFGTPADSFHGASITAVHHGKACLGQQTAHVARFSVARAAFRGRRTAKDGDDALVCLFEFVFLFQSFLLVYIKSLRRAWILADPIGMSVYCPSHLRM